jgi:ABC-type molybdate transport system substrate-binding protein
MSSPARAAEPILVYAAGSLRAPLRDVVDNFRGSGGADVTAKFGPSGLLLGLFRPSDPTSGGGGLGLDCCAR